MADIIIVGGFGPGIATAVAEKFGAAGFTVALVARNAERLAAGVAALEAKGIKGRRVPGRLGSPAAVKAMVAEGPREARPSLGAALECLFDRGRRRFERRRPRLAQRVRRRDRRPRDRRARVASRT